MTIARSPSGNRLVMAYQCRVVPELDVPKKLRLYPVNYDSSVIFPTEGMAMGYFPTYLQSLYELGLLKEKQGYQTAIVTLTYLDGEV